MKKFTTILPLLLLPLAVFAKDYYVTQSGTGTGTTSSSPWSVAAYNSSSLPTGGDTVYFSGTITSTVTPKTSGTGNGAGRLVLDFSAATLSTSSIRILNSGRNYITYDGGGTWTQAANGVDSTYKPAGTFGPTDNATCFYFNTQSCHDITITGFQSISSSSTATSTFIDGRGASFLTVANNKLMNMHKMIYADGLDSHDLTISNNYFQTSINVTDQTDILTIADAYNITIEGNKFIQRAPGATAGRHNDIIQTYQSGASQNRQPYGWIIRYNWLELNVVGGSGDTSVTMLENFTNNGATPALKTYGNLIVGTDTDTGSNNGFGGGEPNTAHTIYCYNNTIIRRTGPNNTFGWNGTNALYCRNNVGWSPASFWDGSAFNISAGASWDYNYFYNWQAPTAAMAGTHGSRTKDPLFTNPAANDYSTQSTSPLRGGGDNSIGAEYNQGIAFGATWPNPKLVSRGTSWDAGAYQYSAAGGTSAVPPSNAQITVTTP